MAHANERNDFYWLKTSSVNHAHYSDVELNELINGVATFNEILTTPMLLTNNCPQQSDINRKNAAVLLE